MSKAKKPPAINPTKDQTLADPPAWMLTHYRQRHQQKRQQETRITLSALILLITLCLIISALIKP